MVFNEIYGCYYIAVAKMIALAIKGELTEGKMNEIAAKHAFSESLLTIVPALKNQKWQLIDHDFKTPIRNKPSMPLTTLEKRWLKTILLDPRVVLFQPPMNELDDTEPLLEPADIVYFDRYLDGDKYDDPSYVARFHIIRQAIQERKKLLISFLSGRQQKKTGVYEPIKLEYSDKEDKFRVLCSGRFDIRTINLGRIIECEMLPETFAEETSLQSRKRDTLIFELVDERNALERAMMEFAHLKKRVERTGEKQYRVEMEYDVDDEPELLIQMLSFGSCVKILAPDRLKEELCRRIERQLKMLRW